MKYVSMDTETTGLLECPGASVVEFAAVLDDLKKPLPLDKLPVFHCYVKQTEYTGQPYAMWLNATILKRIADEEEGYLYLTPEEVGPAFKAWLEANSYNRKCDHVKNGDAVLVNPAGKNFFGFDKPFLERLPGFSDHVQFSQRGLDPAILYLLPEDFRAPDMKTCMQRAKIDGEVEHTAEADAKVVVKLLRRGLKIAVKPVKESEDDEVG